MAKKRLAAIREFSDLGSGFRVAALDLEIRGAGNLLGGEQSGHIEAVGFDMYMKLLEQTIKELKGEELEDELRANVNLRVDLRIDDDDVPDMNQRPTVSRRMAARRAADALEKLAAAAPAEARGWHRGGGNDAAIAVGAGILGLAVGAAIASDRPYYNDYYAAPAYYPSYPVYGYYNSYPAYRAPRYDYREYRGYKGHRPYNGNPG